MPIDWKESPSETSSKSGTGNAVWFAVSIGLMGLIIGYVLAKYTTGQLAFLATLS